MLKHNDNSLLLSQNSTGVYTTFIENANFFIVGPTSALAFTSGNGIMSACSNRNGTSVVSWFYSVWTYSVFDSEGWTHRSLTGLTNPSVSIKFFNSK